MLDYIATIIASIFFLGLVALTFFIAIYWPIVGLYYCITRREDEPALEEIIHGRKEDVKDEMSINNLSNNSNIPNTYENSYIERN